MRNRFFLLAVLLLSFFQLPSAAQTLDLRQVTSDSLVTFLRSDLGVKVYFIKDAGDEAFYSVNAPRAQFTAAALEELHSKGYIARQKDGAWWISVPGALSMKGLPSGYFDRERVADKNSERPGQEGQTVTFQNKIYEIGRSTSAKQSSRAVVHGYVRDVSTQEPLVGVSVFSEKTGAYTVTDAYGFYRITLPMGDCVLGFSGYSMEDVKLNLKVWDDGALDVTMKEQVTALKGAVATASGHNSLRESLSGVETVRIGTIKKVPTAFGEADVLKVVMTLPGVKSVGEAASGFNVRGGATDQNLILFNDETIFSPSHMFGILSAFNAELINDVELYKGAIPAEFGGRISSVLDIRGKEGNASKLTGSIGLGLLTSSISLEGPLKKGKTTFVLGGRTTYSDWMLGVLPEESAYNGGRAGFSDLNASLTHRFNDRNSLQACAYWSNDNFSFSADTTFRYSNLNASLKWRSRLGDHLSMSLTTGFDSFDSSLEDVSYAMQAYRLTTGIRQAYARLGFKATLGRHSLSYGLHGTAYDLTPGSKKPTGEKSMITAATLDTQNALEGAAYLQETWTPGRRFSIDAGIRYSAFGEKASGAIYHNPEYRASMKVGITRSTTFKTGYNTMTQYLHMISNNTSVSPVDTWHLSTDRVKPQTGWQGTAGLYQTLGDGTAELSVEGYWKRMYDYLDYKSGAVLSMNPDLEDALIPTTGKAWGVECMLRKSSGKLNGWVAYTWSRTFLRETTDRGIETINGGAWYCAPSDKPHDVKVVANYKFTHRYSLSVNADYSTGRPVTIPVGKFHYANSYALAYSERNAYRIPDYFRMDMALNIDPGHNLKKATHASMTLGVYNITGRRNAYSIYYTASSLTEVKGRMLCVFAMPIPYMTFNIRF